MLRRLIVIVLIAWLSFWSGNYLGELNATSAWAASERSDLQALSLLKRIVDRDPSVSPVLAAQVDARKVELDRLEEAQRYSLPHFVLFPVLAPFRRLALTWL